MSLLDSKTNADIIVYHETVYTDEDGNTMLGTSTDGVPTRAEIQVLQQSGTSARRVEQDNEGFETEEIYRLRFPRHWNDTQPELGIRAQIEWRDRRWSVVGFPRHYNGSQRTRHIDYQIKRA